jgi:hypothetical protein
MFKGTNSSIPVSKTKTEYLTHGYHGHQELLPRTSSIISSKIIRLKEPQTFGNCIGRMYMHVCQVRRKYCRPAIASSSKADRNWLDIKKARRCFVIGVSAFEDLTGTRPGMGNESRMILVFCFSSYLRSYMWCVQGLRDSKVDQRWRRKGGHMEVR